MKRETRRHITHSEPKQRALRLSKDTVRTLSSTDLTEVVGGSCETGSLTTDSWTRVNDHG
jgi:hypothetical protein